MLEPVQIHCPYCGEPMQILVDASVDSQRYIEDCQVCCCPIEVAVAIDDEGVPHVDVATENDG
ncbi:CPXCG motif-containing cysteine-rich protein [Dyella solisilvae]|uniref:CPXCG motif-containing cysteine-rich protein n=2 Tax=Dyella solisilvae TaxID=1920168 RepID=A0A370KDJ4_9GAMM|nr:CPXCG motif-containing cysteine-rich protein [Dyella solisilvae]RDJ00716.1 CPXCG motif-containing cysteine-rich protein [Dyella solisilvae]